MDDKEAPKSAAIIKTGGKELRRQSATITARIFRDDPVLRYIMCSMPEAERVAYLDPYIQVLFDMAARNGGIFQEADDWSSVALWLQPGRRIDGVMTILRTGMLRCVFKMGLGSAKKMMFDFQANTDRLKKQVMGSKSAPYHYLFFIGTEDRARGQGLASQLIKTYQTKARETNLPIWLEATTEHSRGVYARCGFRDVGVIPMGVGTHAANGAREKGGPGIKIWAMIWEPGKDGEPA